MKTSLSFIIAMLLMMAFITGCQTESEPSGENELQVSGKIVSNSECKSSKSASLSIDIPDSLSCIDYSYNSSSHLLSFIHINAGFNCCPDSIYCTVTAIGDSIVVQEFEKSALCNCNCLFDLYFELTGVVAKVYHVRFIEPYADGQELLYFDLDLINQPQGSVCVVREHYPWGTF